MNRKLKILHVVATLNYGGVSLMLQKFYKYIDRNRFSFDFITHGKYDPLHDSLIENGAKIFYLDTLGTLGFNRYIKKLETIMLENGPYDIIHIHTNYQSGIVGFAARGAGIKIRIAHIRGSYIQSVKIRLLIPVFRQFIKNNITHRLSCNLDAGYFYFKDYNFKIIPNAVDRTEYFNTIIDEKKILVLRDDLSIENQIVVSHIGRFSKEKNHKYLVEIIRRIQNSPWRDKFVFLLIGEGCQKKDIEKKIRKYKLQKCTRLLGIRTDISDLLSISKILVLPSISEGMPNVVIQAQARGVNCLISNIITKDVDMGINLVKYIGIKKKDISIWCKEMIACVDHELINFKEIEDQMMKRGFVLPEAKVFLEDYYDKIVSTTDV